MKVILMFFFMSVAVLFIDARNSFVDLNYSVNNDERLELTMLNLPSRSLSSAEPISNNSVSNDDNNNGNTWSIPVWFYLLAFGCLTLAIFWDSDRNYSKRKRRHKK